MNKFFTLIPGSALALLSLVNLTAAEFTLESGNYKVLIGDRQEKMSVAQIFYKECELGTRTGFYASVLAAKHGRYIGAGHNEGGVEKVLSTTLAVDGKEIPVADGSFKGKTLVFTKKAMLADTELTSTLTLTGDGLKEERVFKALADQPIDTFYIYQYCLNKASTDYLFFRADGTKGEGKFLNDEQMRVYGENNAYCFSQFFPAFKLGIINYMAGFGPGKGKNLLWDRKVYHKYYFWPDLPAVLKKGYTSQKWTMIVRAFPASDRAAWLARAEKLNAELRKEFPFAAKPAKQEPLRGTTFELKGSPKFQVQKIALQLEPNANYSIAFAIRKTGQFSAKPSDHYALVGGYDAQRKFHSLVNMGDSINPDGEWHTCRRTFTAPGYDTFLYIYNSRGTGVLELKDLVVEKQ